MRTSTRVGLASLLAVGGLMLQTGGPLAGASVASAQAATPAPSQHLTFLYSGGPQYFTVPAGVHSLNVTVAGAAGGNGTNRTLPFSSFPGDVTDISIPGGVGGTGGLISATVGVNPNDQVRVYVGSRGADAGADGSQEQLGQLITGNRTDPAVQATGAAVDTPAAAGGSAAGGLAPGGSGGSNCGPGVLTSVAGETCVRDGGGAGGGAASELDLPTSNGYVPLVVAGGGGGGASGGPGFTDSAIIGPVYPYKDTGGAGGNAGNVPTAGETGKGAWSLVGTRMDVGAGTGGATPNPASSAGESAISSSARTAGGGGGGGFDGANGGGGFAGLNAAPGSTTFGLVDYTVPFPGGGGGGGGQSWVAPEVSSPTFSNGNPGDEGQVIIAWVPAPVMTMSLTPASARVGDPLTALVSVPPAPGGAATPSGTVRWFLDQDTNPVLTTTLASGLTNLNFGMNGVPMLTQGGHTLHAIYSGDGVYAQSGVSTDLTILPPPPITLSASSLSWTQSLGVPATQTLTITDTGSTPISMSGLQLKAPNSKNPFSGTALGFSMTGDTCVTLFPGLSCTVSIQFKPNALGNVQASLNVLDTAPGGLQSVALTGLGVAPGAPAVTGLSPQTGYTYGGTTVTISGINLANITEVDFGGQPGTNLKCGATSCTVTSPMSVNGAEGMVDVQVKTANGTTTSPGVASYKFNYILHF